MFLVSYAVALRLAAGWMTARLHRAGGAGKPSTGSTASASGWCRAWCSLGVFYLVFNMATPPDLILLDLRRQALGPLAREAGADRQERGRAAGPARLQPHRPRPGAGGLADNGGDEDKSWRTLRSGRPRMVRPRGGITQRKLHSFRTGI